MACRAIRKCLNLKSNSFNLCGDVETKTNTEEVAQVICMHFQVTTFFSLFYSGSRICGGLNRSIYLPIERMIEWTNQRTNLSNKRTNDEHTMCHCLAFDHHHTQLTIYLFLWGLWNRFHRTFLIVSMCISENSFTKCVRFSISFFKLSFSYENSEELELFPRSHLSWVYSIDFVYCIENQEKRSWK